MMFLIMAFVFIVYLLLSVAVILFAVKRAKASGRRPWLWGGIAALVMYNVVFWDWIPTVLVHKYYCETEAGFWVYKTVDEWKAENPGVMERVQGVAPKIERTEYGDRQMLNRRFAMEIYRNTPVPFLSTEIAERVVVDLETKAILAKSIEVGSGYGSLSLGKGGMKSLKFWLFQKPCINYEIWGMTKQILMGKG